MALVPRQALHAVKERLLDWPAVALIGPRQSGKTTLARSLGRIYFDLEQELDRLKLDLSWDELTSSKQLIVLDEAQAWPEVFNRLRGTIDQRRKQNGRFLILGSVSPSLMSRVSESLAGRLALVELTPLLWGELKTAAVQKRLWPYGGFPDGGVLNTRRYGRWQRDYLTLLTQRDLPNWGLPAKPQITDRLLRMLATVHGQVFNATQIGNSLGLSYQTVINYLDYLIGAFLIRRLPPYHANIRKRLVKRPKLYWRDSGLLHVLLNVTDTSMLLNQPWVGASWEGFVIEQILGMLGNGERQPQAFYFRTSDQYELDLVLDFGHQRWAIEVKLTGSPGPADMNRLHKTADLIGASKCFLVSQTKKTVESKDRVSCNMPWLLEHLQQQLR